MRQTYNATVTTARATVQISAADIAVCPVCADQGGGVVVCEEGELWLECRRCAAETGD